ncbi:DUF805 domain-containing protein [Vallitalea okinawensis]|uniref:DUF805 domain-containing protein n=1 Tax=Vallitalea okinawensis TaxID=2078660 RepID=UPI000CFDA203|nr:DUF805 domain-containing protein [Vallitalea okinawensis]
MKEQLKKLINTFFSFKGRINRLAYFGYGCVLFAYWLIIYLILMLSEPTTVELIIFLVLMILPFVSSTSLHVRRLHDLNHSGWWAIVIFIGVLSIPVISNIISLIAGIYLTFWKGTDGPNDYGNDPLNDDPFMYDTITQDDEKNIN